MSFTFSNKKNVFFIVVAAISVFDLAIFFCLPLLSSIRQELKANESLIQFSAATNVFGIGVSSIIYGTLSDSLGRRKLVLFGIACFSIASYSISFINSIYLLFILRFIQGLGAGVAWSIGNAILHDIYKGKEFEKAIITLHIIIGIMVAVSPALGGFIGNIIGWRKSFQFMAYSGALLFIYSLFFLPETLQSLKTNVNLKTIINNYITLFKNRVYIRFLSIKVIMVSVAFVNITTLPLLFVETHNSTIENCGLLMALGAFIFTIGGVINNKLVDYFEVNEIIKFSLYLVILSSIVLFIIQYLGILNAIGIQLIKIPYLLGISGIFGNATHKIVGAVPKLSGSASSIMITLEMFVSSIGVRLVSVFYNVTIYPMEIYAIVAAIISLFALSSKNIKLNGKNSCTI
jgi:DHA1 family bicyclomycin/chloramphenicol resistance-like MFS transporter